MALVTPNAQGAVAWEGRTDRTDWRIAIRQSGTVPWGARAPRGSWGDVGEHGCDGRDRMGPIAPQRKSTPHHRTGVRGAALGLEGSVVSPTSHPSHPCSPTS